MFHVKSLLRCSSEREAEKEKADLELIIGLLEGDNEPFDFSISFIVT